MHIALLIVGILALIASIALFANASETVGPAHGMWAGTMGDLMSGEPFRSKTMIRGPVVAFGVVSLLIAIGCFIAAFAMWP